MIRLLSMLFLAAALASGCSRHVHQSFSAQNISNENIAIALVQGARADSDYSERETVLGPRGRFDYSAKLPRGTSAVVRLQRVPAGVVPATIVDLYPKGSVKVDLDASGDQIILRNLVVRTDWWFNR